MIDGRSHPLAKVDISNRALVLRILANARVKRAKPVRDHHKSLALFELPDWPTELYRHPRCAAIRSPGQAQRWQSLPAAQLYFGVNLVPDNQCPVHPDRTRLSRFGGSNLTSHIFPKPQPPKSVMRNST
jgi:hypothetical protein